MSISATSLAHRPASQTSPRRGLRPLHVDAPTRRELRRRLLAGPELISFRDEPRFCALVAALGIQGEVGTENDEMARFVFDADTGGTVARARLRAEIVELNGSPGVRIFAADGPARLEFRFAGFRPLLHPTFSFDAEGEVTSAVLFPESIARIAALEGAELVVVRDWAINTVFGGFSEKHLYYRTNFWELEHNDALCFARLVERRQLAFLGTHDIVAHVAGIDGAALTPLQRRARKVRESLERYLGGVPKPSVASLVVPYATGVLLDDLAQPPNYGSAGRLAMVDALCAVMDERLIEPSRPAVLTRFPGLYEKVITTARDGQAEHVVSSARGLAQGLVAEIQALTIEQ